MFRAAESNPERHISHLILTCFKYNVYIVSFRWNFNAANTLLSAVGLTDSDVPAVPMCGHAIDIWSDTVLAFLKTHACPVDSTRLPTAIIYRIAMKDNSNSHCVRQSSNNWCLPDPRSARHLTSKGSTRFWDESLRGAQHFRFVWRRWNWYAWTSLSGWWHADCMIWSDMTLAWHGQTTLETAVSLP